MRGYGFGLIGDIVIGIIGAFIATGCFPRLDIHLGTELVSAIINATIGAVVLSYPTCSRRVRLGLASRLRPALVDGRGSVTPRQ